MTEGVTYKLSLKDAMSGAMQKLRATARVVFDGVNGDVKKTQTALNDVGRTNTKIKVDSSALDDASRKADALADKMGRLRDSKGRFMAGGGSGGGGRFSLGALGGIGGFGMSGFGGMLAGLGGAALITAGIANSTQAGLQGQAQRASFETIAGKQEGGALYGNVTKFAQQSIYGNELYGQAQTQLAFGAAAQEVMPTLKMLGDIAMGDKQRMESLNLAYSQVRAAGKLTGQDLLQFVNAGFNPLQEISAKTGRSMTALREDMSKGLITFDQVRGAFKNATEPGGKFYKMVDTMAKTDFGKVENFRGQLDALKLKLGETTAPLAGRFIDTMANPGLDFINKEIVPKLGRFLEGLSDYGPVIKDIASATYQTVKPVLGMLASNDFKQLVIESGKFTKNLIEGLGPAVKATTDVFGELIKVIKPILSILGSGNQEQIDARAGVEMWDMTPDGFKKFQELEYKRQAGKGLRGSSAYNFTQQFLPYISKSDPTGGVGFPFIKKGMATLPPAGAPAPNTLGAAAAALAGGSSSSGGGASAITGGGTKTVNVYFNKEIVAANGITIQVNGDAQDGAREAKKQLEQELKMLGYSIGNSINE